MKTRSVSNKSPVEILLFAVLLLVMFSYFYHPDGWNGNSRVSLIFSLVHEGRPEIDSYHNNPGTETGDKSFYNGHYYSDKAIGMSLLGVMIYAPMNWIANLFQLQLNIEIKKYILTIALSGLPGVFCGMLVHQLCFQVAKTKLSKPHLASFLAAAGIVLATMYFPFSLVLFSHILSAAFLFGAFYMIFQFKDSIAKVRISNLFTVGFLLGMAIITEYTTAIIVVCLIFYYFYIVWCRAGIRNIWVVLIPCIGGLIPIVIHLIYNFRCFDTYFTFPYSYHANEDFKSGMSQGLMGIHMPSLKVLFYLTFHPAMGIFWQSPVLLLVPIGLGGMWKNIEYRAETILIMTIAIIMLLLNSGYYMWWGGWSFAPRHLVPMLPFLALAYIYIPKKLIPVGILLGVISLIQMMLVSIVRIGIDDTLMVQIGEIGFFKYSTIYSVILPNLLANYTAYNVGKMMNIDGLLSVIPVVVFMVIMLVVIIKVAITADRRENSQPLLID